MREFMVVCTMVMMPDIACCGRNKATFAIDCRLSASNNISSAKNEVTGTGRSFLTGLCVSFAIASQKLDKYEGIALLVVAVSGNRIRWKLYSIRMFVTVRIPRYYLYSSSGTLT